MVVAVWEGFLEKLVLDWTLEVIWKDGTFRVGGRRWVRGGPRRRALQRELDPESTQASGHHAESLASPSPRVIYSESNLLALPKLSTVTQPIPGTRQSHTGPINFGEHLRNSSGNYT